MATLAALAQNGKPDATRLTDAERELLAEADEGPLRQHAKNVKLIKLLEARAEEVMLLEMVAHRGPRAPLLQAIPLASSSLPPANS